MMKSAMLYLILNAACLVADISVRRIARQRFHRKHAPIGYSSCASAALSSLLVGSCDCSAGQSRK